MKLTRRQFIAGTSAFVISTPAIGAMTPENQKLVAKAGSVQLLPGQYPKTEIWGYGGHTPGPELRLRQGARIRRDFVNLLPQASTVHWHGIRIDNKMDGVPELTQTVVRPNNSFTYDFVVPDAGTYWYHPHNKTSEQMARGLYGALIVEENNPPEVDTDETLIIDDWRLDKTGQINDSFEAVMDMSHGGRLGNWLTVNGEASYSRTVKKNERLRLRLINSSNSRIFSLNLKGLTGWVIALDGQPLDTPTSIKQLVLAPAQRIDLIVDVSALEGETAHVYSIGREGQHQIVGFTVDGIKRHSMLPTPRALPANPVLPIDPKTNPQKVSLRMEGGAMGRMRGARMGGEMMGMRQLVNAGKVWAFNGRVDMPDSPLIDAQRGKTVQIEMINETGWPHAMHLHGFHFRQVYLNGKMGPLRDTLLMDGNTTATIAFIADNPGKWLLHCHMLEHASSGMTTWIHVN